MTRTHERFAFRLAVLALVSVGWSCSSSSSSPPASGQETPPVRLLEDGRIAVESTSPLLEKLAVTELVTSETSAPARVVTGSVVARIVPGPGPKDERWEFATPELASAYAEWTRTQAEVTFHEGQASKVRRLHTARVQALERSVERLRQLVDIGTESARDLTAREAELLEARLEADRAAFEANMSARQSSRTLDALARQLRQEGVDPAVLGSAPEGAVILAADVPELALSLARVGVVCEVRFVAERNGPARDGRVVGIASSLSREQRTLRAVIELPDPDGNLRPGMFAEIGLGAGAREIVLVPTLGILHVGRADYVLIAEPSNTFRIAEVKVGRSHGSDQAELLEGPAAGTPIVTDGAILLKPFVSRARQTAARTGNQR
jgi:cobalt-zinc-cadmium efflux system membrane fusion protein